MAVWKGEVSKTSERDWGSKTLYSFQFKGANLWFRVEEDPKLVVGEWIECEGPSPNKIERIERVTEEDVKEAAQAPASGSKEAPPTSSPDYWRWKQMRDIEREEAFLWRDARADAVRIITACLAHDSETSEAKNTILSLGTKKSGKLDVMRGMINTLAEQFVEDFKERIDGS